MSISRSIMVPIHPSGRNMRSVWTFPTGSYSGAHFAVYPPRLPELCIRASTSEAGCCPSCGSPWARVTKSQVTDTRPGKNVGKGKSGTNDDPNQSLHQRDISRYRQQLSRVTLGWRPTCKCDAGSPVPCWILDPFSGAGTTALAAERLGRDSVNIDTSAAYSELARQRLLEDKKKR